MINSMSPSTVIKQLLISVVGPVRHAGVLAQKMIPRGILELVSPFMESPGSLNGARDACGRDTPIIFLRQNPRVPHWNGL
jgi:hypothetical protein